VTLLCADAVVLTTRPATPAAIMRFTVGTPDVWFVMWVLLVCSSGGTVC
jgi:hypothetical protein